MRMTLSCGAALLAILAGTASAQLAGPSSSASSYIVPSGPKASLITTTAVITTGDAVGVGGYRMVGIPDGLGAFDNGDGTFTLAMNHELGAGSGIVRAHGTASAFVSRWVIRKSDLTVAGAGLWLG